MSVVLVDYGAGNLRSAAKALEVAGARDLVISSDPEKVAAAARIVLPGDGAFPDCRRGLAAVDGLSEALEEAVHTRGAAFFGICIGMQLLATRGVEHEGADGLDWIPGEVVRITPSDAALKVPHMGWNNLERDRDHPLLKDVPLGPDGLHAFFLHAYHFVPADPQDVLAHADYGGRVTAMVARGNVAGTQFHPEKSQRLGLTLIANFLRWTP
ncbi:imidazole glycerol phosphate synthase subunit HisH [Terrihabitans sp. B22-R8]|uniref:imidazole glycerol phosphate synthase subunit HisH n=1 Tax=Terrihabitans sp. B22-R8 TaxID=3425128 RepID=UPI00403CBE91